MNIGPCVFNTRPAVWGDAWHMSHLATKATSIATAALSSPHILCVRGHTTMITETDIFHSSNHTKIGER